MNKTGYYVGYSPSFDRVWRRYGPAIMWKGKGGLWYKWDGKPIEKLIRNSKQ